MTYHSKNKVQVVIISLILIILVLASPGVSPSTSDGEPPFLRGNENLDGYIFTIVDYGLDENNDTSYDKLYLSIGINLDVAAQYRVYADMSPSGIRASDNISAHFEAGKQYIELSFDGAVIYTSGRDGPYNIIISLYTGTKLLEEMEYTTSQYKFEEFNPKPAPEVPERASIEVVNNTIKLKTEVFTAVIYELTPIIVFHYTSDDGKVARFKVSYQRELCYDDQNHDGNFQDSELRYFADLQTSSWNSMKVLMENYNSFDFLVQSVVALKNIADMTIDTKLKLTFHYSSTTKKDNLNAAQKFDISIDIVGSPLNGITHLALEQTLEDELGNHDLFEQASGDETKVSFMTRDGLERGYYSWKNSFIATTDTGGSSPEIVTYNLQTTSDSSTMKLYLNYQYTPDITDFFHDPKVGVDPSNSPMLPGPVKPKIINHQIFIYLLVAVIAAVVMIGNIFRQKSKKKR